MIEVQKVAKKPQGELRLGASEKYRLDGGLCLSSQESAIKLTQSPYIENMNGDDKGALIGRMGQANVFTLAGGAINGAYPEYKGYSIFAHGTKLYKQLGSATPEEIYSSLTDSKAFLFVFNGILYLMNGHEYIQYDGVTVKPVEAYIPEAVESRKPDGTQSTLKEPLNLFGDWWSESFSSDGTTVYHLTAQNLEAIGEVKVNGVVKTLTTDYTVDVAKGLVTFNTAIPESIPNNVKIKCKKSNPEGKAAILGCTFGEEFGGSLWITGNPATPNKLWKTGLTDYNEANYFPASGRRSFEIVGGADKAITGFIKQYDKMIILKEDCLKITYSETQSDGSIGFPIQNLNSNIGCDIPGSIQLIKNNPVFANTNGGVYMVVSTQLEGEKNVIPISENVNGIYYRPGLLQEPNLKEASSLDDGTKYYLCVNDKVYLWDYNASFSVGNPESLMWYYYTNINAKAFYRLDNETYYLHRAEGRLIKFIEASNDFGQPIKQAWRSKLIDFGYADYLKSILRIWLTTKANSGSNIKIKYTDGGEITIPNTVTQSFKWSTFKWSGFTWKVVNKPPTIPLKPKLRKQQYFQIELSCEAYNERLSIIGLVISYSVDKRIK